ncbi:EAL domain-containing protein [Nocardioides ultimimeridianus]
MDGDPRDHDLLQADPGGHVHDDQMHLLIEASPSAMLLVDGGGRIVLVNSEAERSFGYTRDELLRMNVDALVPASARDAHVHARENYLVHPSRRGMGVGRELYGVRKDGTELPIEIGLNPITIDEQPHVLASIIDITERRRGQAEVDAARQAQQLRTILATLPLSVIATDLVGRIVTANPAAEELVGYRQEELVGSALTAIDAERRRSEEVEVPVLRDIGTSIEWSYRRKDGSVVPVSEEVVVLKDDDGTPTGYLVVAFDITQRIEARQRADHVLHHDQLTDLPNRTQLVEQLDIAMRRAERNGTEVALLLLDLDHFNRINDTLGHHIGDELLLAVAERLRGWVRGADMVARLGGDEFAIVMDDLTPGTDLSERIAGMLASLLAPIQVQGYDVVVTASIGGTTFPRDGDSPATLLRHADVAMYRAKASGRDSLAWFDVAMIDEVNEKLALSGALRNALAHGELAVVYQPQFDLTEGRLIGFEALARWHSAELGTVSPDRFIPVAEDSGLILELGEWVLRTACADIAVLQRAVKMPLRLAVNASPRQLHGAGWVDLVTSALEDSGLEPWQLGIEITEGILLEDNGDAVASLQALRARGVEVIVDDFGCGYSSLAYLTRFPIDKIKIDRSFVAPIASVDDDAAVVDAIIGMAHALGMVVVAEGVETEAQEEYLRSRGCDQVQGYRYGKGVPLGDAARIPRTLAPQTVGA